MKQIISFIAGFLLSSAAWYGSFYLDASVPLSDGRSFEVSAPHDFISEGDIRVYDNMVVIKVSGASISRYAPTGSMRPLLDERANGIRIVPTSEDQIKVGDIISFQRGSNLIVHRVVEKGTDDEGTYFVTKGDNNVVNDGKVRFKDVRFLTIGVLW